MEFLYRLFFQEMMTKIGGGGWGTYKQIANFIHIIHMYVENSTFKLEIRGLTYT
jgi:hypothetical protein